MTLIKDKKINFDYEILETLEAGIKLHGLEVKSLREKRGSLTGSYVTIKKNEAFLVGANIPPFQPANKPKEYDPLRSRKLLLSKKEISYLLGKEKQKGLTIVPVSMYNAGRNIKVSIAIVRGKKKFDKRETLKKRDIERDLGRTLKN